MLSLEPGLPWVRSGLTASSLPLVETEQLGFECLLSHSLAVLGKVPSLYELRFPVL